MAEVAAAEHPRIIAAMRSAVADMAFSQRRVKGLCSKNCGRAPFGDKAPTPGQRAPMSTATKKAALRGPSGRRWGERPTIGSNQRWRALKRGLLLQITKTLPRRRTTLQS